MQSKAILRQLKRLERMLLRTRGLIIFFGEPSKAELDQLSPDANVVIFIGEDTIQDYVVLSYRLYSFAV